jgi:carbohydrate kinase (thermoresistant glucokinase family)
MPNDPNSQKHPPLPFLWIGSWPDTVLAVGKRFHELLLQCRQLDDHFFHQECLALSEAAARLSLPSLDFAVLRLAAYRSDGIRSVNVGGTMGCGKSSIAEFLEHRLQFSLQDADYFHTDAARSKMSRGEPLSDADRKPFLAATQEWLALSRKITTCSALSDLYRAILFGQEAEIVLQQDDARRSNPWQITARNLHLLLITLVKPYEVALEELDASVTMGPARLFDGKPHFIQVSKASEAAGIAAGKTPLLQSQYKMLAEHPPYPWDTLVIDALSLRGTDGRYSETAPLEALLALPFLT